MNLLIPDSGLIFWMTLIFAIVFFILAKFGFPAITKTLENRKEKIEDSLQAAQKISEELANLEARKEQILTEAQNEKSEILSQATRQRQTILDKAKQDAERQALIILEHAKDQIAIERENALREVRSIVGHISVNVAEKVLEKELDNSKAQKEYLDNILNDFIQ